MKAIIDAVIDKDQWMVELGLNKYTPAQQRTLWDLVARALQTKAMDVLLDQLSQEDQRRFVQYLSEDELSEQLVVFLGKKIPGYSELLSKALLEYKKELKRNLSRLTPKVG